MNRSFGQDKTQPIVTAAQLKHLVVKGDINQIYDNITEITQYGLIEQLQQEQRQNKTDYNKQAVQNLIQQLKNTNNSTYRYLIQLLNQDKSLAVHYLISNNYHNSLITEHNLLILKQEITSQTFSAANWANNLNYAIARLQAELQQYQSIDSQYLQRLTQNNQYQQQLLEASKYLLIYYLVSNKHNLIELERKWKQQQQPIQPQQPFFNQKVTQQHQPLLFNPYQQTIRNKLNNLSDLELYLLGSYFHNVNSIKTATEQFDSNQSQQSRNNLIQAVIQSNQFNYNSNLNEITKRQYSTDKNDVNLHKFSGYQPFQLKITQQQLNGSNNATNLWQYQQNDQLSSEQQQQVNELSKLTHFEHQLLFNKLDQSELTPNDKITIKQYVNLQDATQKTAFLRIIVKMPSFNKIKNQKQDHLFSQFIQILLKSDRDMFDLKQIAGGYFEKAETLCKYLCTKYNDTIHKLESKLPEKRQKYVANVLKIQYPAIYRHILVRNIPNFDQEWEEINKITIAQQNYYQERNNEQAKEPQIKLQKFDQQEEIQSDETMEKSIKYLYQLDQFDLWLFAVNVHVLNEKNEQRAFNIKLKDKIFEYSLQPSVENKKTDLIHCLAINYDQSTIIQYFDFKTLKYFNTALQNDYISEYSVRLDGVKKYRNQLDVSKQMQTDFQENQHLFDQFVDKLDQKKQQVAKKLIKFPILYLHFLKLQFPNLENRYMRQFDDNEEQLFNLQMKTIQQEKQKTTYNQQPVQSQLNAGNVIQLPQQLNSDRQLQLNQITNDIIISNQVNKVSQRLENVTRLQQKPKKVTQPSYFLLSNEQKQQIQLNTLDYESQYFAAMTKQECEYFQSYQNRFIENGFSQQDLSNYYMKSFVQQLEDYVKRHPYYRYFTDPAVLEPIVAENTDQDEQSKIQAFRANPDLLTYFLFNNVKNFEAIYQNYQHPNITSLFDAFLDEQLIMPFETFQALSEENKQQIIEHAGQQTTNYTDYHIIFRIVQKQQLNSFKEFVKYSDYSSIQAYCAFKLLEQRQFDLQYRQMSQITEINNVEDLKLKIENAELTAITLATPQLKPLVKSLQNERVKHNQLNLTLNTLKSQIHKLSTDSDKSFAKHVLCQNEAMLWYFLWHRMVLDS